MVSRVTKLLFLKEFEWHRLPCCKSFHLCTKYFVLCTSFSPTLAAMMAFLKGDFVHKTPAGVQVDVNGVGYDVQISLNTYSRIQSLDRGILFTHLHIQEDAHTLYGFFEMAEKEMFLQLISIRE